MPDIRRRPLKAPLDAFSADWHPLVRSIYASRVSSAAEVEKSLQHLLPPDGLPDIAIAAARLANAIAQHEDILIYGDYDVDGACATALMVRVLRRLGASVRYFVPNRQIHGYGLSIAGLASQDRLPQLLITVDNGIRSHAAADWLAERGISLIITDHHEPDTALPCALACVNPKCSGSRFASPNLAGVGAAFYLLLALRSHYRSQAWEFPAALTDYLDLVALGTASDIVPLDYNNRILVHAGIRQLRSGMGNAGIRALCAAAGIDTAAFSPSDFGFAIGPRLNAVGRLEDMHDGVRLLTTDDWATAEEYAALLDELNRERKAIESGMTARAARLVNPSEPIASAYIPDGHEGVIGIIASRMKGRYARPALAAADTACGSKIKASLRSISGVNIHDLLTAAAAQLPDGVLQYGGHAMAAGLSVEKAYYRPLLDALNRAFTAQIGSHIPEEPLYIDGELPDELLSLSWARYLENLEPWGAGLPAPQFCNTFTVAECRRLGAQHTRLTLRHPESGRQLEAVWFFHSANYQYGDAIRTVYQIQVNRFGGSERLNLLITYAEPSAIGTLRTCS